MFNQNRLAYLTHADIRTILPSETLVAINAPYGSTLEVPDPDEGMPAGRRRYEVQLTSRSGPIDVFLILEANTATAAEVSAENNTHTVISDPTAGAIDRTSFFLRDFEEDGLLQHFEFPSDPYNFEMKPGEGLAELYNDVLGNPFSIQSNII